MDCKNFQCKCCWIKLSEMWNETISEDFENDSGLGDSPPLTPSSHLSDDVFGKH